MSCFSSFDLPSSALCWFRDLWPKTNATENNRKTGLRINARTVWNTLFWGLLRTHNVVPSKCWHPTGSHQLAQGEPAPLHSCPADLLPCPPAHGALVRCHRWGTSSRALVSHAFPEETCIRRGCRQENVWGWGYSRQVLLSFPSGIFS